MTRFGDPAEGRRQLDALQPLGHIGEPDDVAWGVLYLASDESKFVTGSELVRGQGQQCSGCCQWWPPTELTVSAGYRSSRRRSFGARKGRNTASC